MRKLILTLVAVASWAAVPAGSALAAPAVAPSHAGAWITDAQGRALVVHGFNMVAKRAPYTTQSVGFGADDAEFLARHGFNAVRLGIQWKAVEPRPGVYDEDYLDEIAATVDLLARYRIYTLIDFHQDHYHESVGGQGFPDWAVDTRAAGTVAGPQGPSRLNPAEYVAWDNFWANAQAPDGVALWERFALFWRHVARRFRDNPWVIGYDLMNEPVAGTQTPLCLNTVRCPSDETLGRFYRYVIPRVRAIDRRHLIWYEPNWLAGAGGAMDIDHGGDKRAVLSFHNYCLITALTSGGLEKERQPACPAIEELTFDNAERQAARNRDGLVMTEFGSVPTVQEVERVAAGADRRRLGWMEWTYHNTGHTNFAGEYSIVHDPAKPPHGDNVNTALLTTLARPYPQTTAGTPERWSFDPTTHTFVLRYTTRRPEGRGRFRAGSITRVVVPRLHYPNGYTVEARGARVASRSGSGVLKLRSAARSTTVEVRVRPRSRAARAG